MYQRRCPECNAPVKDMKGHMTRFHRQSSSIGWIGRNGANADIGRCHPAQARRKQVPRSLRVEQCDNFATYTSGNKSLDHFVFHAYYVTGRQKLLKLSKVFCFCVIYGILLLKYALHDNSVVD